MYWLNLLVLVTIVIGCKKESFTANTPIKPGYQKVTFQQDAYPYTEQTFTQGFAGDRSEETFRQGEFGKLDILIVIDDSLSMAAEQTALAENLKALIGKVEQSDWRIAVMSTDIDDRCHEGIISKGDIDVEGKFSRAIKAGIDGAGEERGIQKAVKGLGRGCRLQPWLRQDSTIAVLIVSDEDNCHTGQDGATSYGCEGEPYRYGDYLLDELRSIRQLESEAKVYGLLWDDQICREDEKDPYAAETVGIEYLKVINATGGMSRPICRGEQYATALDAISDDVRKILKYEFDLKTMPDQGTLKVLVNGEQWTDYDIRDRKVVFTKAPPFGSDVKIRYLHGKNGSIQKSFNIPDEALEGSFEVTANNDTVTPGSYKYNSQRNAVEFTSPPQERATIVMRYKKIVPLRTDFQMKAGMVVSDLEVSVDGKVENAVRYNSSSGMLSFDTAPAELEHITVSFHEQQK